MSLHKWYQPLRASSGAAVLFVSFSEINLLKPFAILDNVIKKALGE